jgi:hypothetical protein
MKWPNRPEAVRQWCNFYHNNNHLVSSIVECESRMGILTVKASGERANKLLKEFDRRIDIDGLFRGVASHGMIYGRVNPFVRIVCPKCTGSLQDKLNEGCKHSGGEITSIEVIDPNYIVEKDGRFLLMANEDLKYVIMKRRPQELYDRIAPFVRKLVLAGEPIPLDKAAMVTVESPSLVYNLIDGCSSQVVAEVGAKWRAKAFEWLKETLDMAAKMGGVKAFSVRLEEPNVKPISKYLPADDIEADWRDVRKYFSEN